MRSELLKTFLARKKWRTRINHAGSRVDFFALVSLTTWVVLGHGSSHQVTSVRFQCSTSVAVYFRFKKWKHQLFHLSSNLRPSHSLSFVFNYHRIREVCHLISWVFPISILFLSYDPKVPEIYSIWIWWGVHLPANFSSHNLIFFSILQAKQYIKS